MGESVIVKEFLAFYLLAHWSIGSRFLGAAACPLELASVGGGGGLRYPDHSAVFSTIQIPQIV